MKKIAILGCGNMAQAIILGLFKEGVELECHTYTPSFSKAEKLALDVKGIAYKSLKDIPECDYYMVGCKPQQFEELARELKNIISKQATVVSILAGTTVSKIQELLDIKYVLRVMPNTPSLVGHGVNALYFSEEVSLGDKTFLTNMFDSFSKTFVFNKENEIDIITGFSGSGPAYIFEFANLMTKKMISMGIGESIAKEMVNHTFLGSSKLLVDSQNDAETLRNNVTSKNGVTYEALEIFKKYNMEAAFNDALDAAYNRSIELSK